MGSQSADSFRVLLWCGQHKAGRGGMETAFERVAAGLSVRGHHVSVALLQHAVDRRWEDRLPHLHVGGYGARREMPAAILWFRGVLGAERPDVVIATDPIAVLLARAALALAGTHAPLMSWIHGDQRPVRHLWAFGLCDDHMTVSEGLAVFMRRRWGRATAVYNPVRLDVRPCTRPGPGEPAQFLCLGRLAPEKRIDRILRALQKVSGGWRLEIVGDGEERRELESMADRLGLEGRITWHGWMADPWSAVSQASALLLTSDTEGFPMVLVEAVARGIPVIAMDCDYGPRDIVCDDNGWLLGPGDVDALARTLDGVVRGVLALPPVDGVRATAGAFEVAEVVKRMEECIRGARARRGYGAQGPD